MAPGIFNLETAPATPAVPAFCGASPEAAAAFLSVLDGCLGLPEPLEPEPPAEPDGTGAGVPFGLVLPCTVTVDLPRVTPIEEPPVPVKMSVPPQIAPAGIPPREPETESGQIVQAALIGGTPPAPVPAQSEIAAPVPTGDNAVAGDVPAALPNSHRAQGDRKQPNPDFPQKIECDLPVPPVAAFSVPSGDTEPAAAPEKVMPEADQQPEVPEDGGEPDIAPPPMAGPPPAPLPEARGPIAGNEPPPQGNQDRPARHADVAEPAPAATGRPLPETTVGETAPRTAAQPLAFAVRMAERNPAPRGDRQPPPERAASITGDALQPEPLPVEPAPVERALPDPEAPVMAEAATGHPDAPLEAKRPEPAPGATRPPAASDAPEKPDAAKPAPPRVAPAPETSRQETSGQGAAPQWRDPRGKEKSRSAEPKLVPATSPEPARTERQAATTVKAEPLAETRLEPEPPPRPAAPVRSMTLRIEGQDQKIDIRMAERAGEIRVAVHAPEGELRSHLQDQLPDLVRGLDRQGFSAETWRPAETSSRSHDGDRGAQDAPPGGGHGGAHQDGRGRRKHPQPGWLEEIGSLEAEPERSSTPWQ